MPHLSHAFSGALRQFSYWIANGSVGHPLLEGVDYSCIFREPSALEQVYAIFANVIEVDESGQVTNAKHAEKRAAQYILQYVTGRQVEPPFEGWEVELHQCMTMLWPNRCIQPGHGHTGETRDLCLECFEQIASPEELTYARHSEEVIRKGKCQYCGAPAVGGSIFSAIPGVNDEETHLWCEQCRIDLVEFANRPENAIADDFDVEDDAMLEQSAQQLAERQRRETEFMRQRVSDRTPQ